MKTKTMNKQLAEIEEKGNTLIKENRFWNPRKTYKIIPNDIVLSFWEELKKELKI